MYSFTNENIAVFEISIKYETWLRRNNLTSNLEKKV